MEPLTFSQNYRENLRLLLRAGYGLNKANSLASLIKQKFEEEKKREFREVVDNKLKSLGL